MPDADRRSHEAILHAARLLEQGELVALPTETVYGLGADAEQREAVNRIYAAKGRPPNHPVIVHVAPGADIAYWAKDIPPEAGMLIEAFWPGPLTLILKRADHIPDTVSGGQDTVGIRCPSHPVAQALLKAFKGGKGGIAAPSANKFGHVSPTTAQHVRDEFGEGPGSPVAAILDGGQSQVGIESTIIDLSRMATHGPVLLRPGHIGSDDIALVLGVAPELPDAAAPRASGTLEAHYAPRTPVALVATDEVSSVIAALSASGKQVALIHYTRQLTDSLAGHFALPSAPVGYAHGLYAALRAMDAVKASIILVEIPPSSPEWQGVNDRLRRAAHDTRGVLGRLVSGG
jgi:L-threonylcarbamoyladenylate synthase